MGKWLDETSLQRRYADDQCTGKGVTKEMDVKTTKRYHFTPTRMVVSEE